MAKGSAMDKTRVVLVDDSVFMLLTLKDMLSGTEFDVVGTAATGAEGLQKYKELRPDMLLLDIVLPDESGIKVLSKVLAFDPQAVVIMVSSLGTQEKVTECLKKGAKHFITKPFQVETLLEALRAFKDTDKSTIAKYEAEFSLAGMDLGMKFFEINMGMKFFGQYLLEKGVITKDQLLKAVEYKKSLNLSMEELAVKKGLLSKEQVDKIHSLQKDDLDRDFADIVEEQEFLGRKELDDLYKEQEQRRVYIGQALVAQGALAPDQLSDNLREFKEEQEKDEWAIATKLEGLRNKLVVKTFVNFTMKIFQKVVRETVKLKECLPSVDNFNLRDYTLQQKIFGDMEMYFILNLSQDLCLKVAANMFGKEVKEMGPIEKDAMKEFLNVISGNCCAKLSNVGINIETGPPQCYSNKGGDQYTLPKKPDIAFALLISAVGDFDLVIIRER
jgi:DNA-binding response OmpR family regulator/CheY-specific phosphatase CheX